MIEFILPEFEEELPTHSPDYQTIKDALLRITNRASLKVNFKHHHKSERYIYFYCTKCSARIRYRYDSSSHLYNLTFLESRHSHSDIGKMRKDLFQDFVQRLPANIETKTIRQLACQQFRITGSQFYYLFKKCFNRVPSYGTLLKQLNQQEYYTQSEPFGSELRGLPDIFLCVSPQMKELFQSFGHCLCFDTTYSIVRPRLEDGKTWKIGIMVGLNQKKKIIPFGFCLITEETSENFYKIFRAFFEIMGKSCDVVLTDESKALKSAFEELKNDREFEGSHLLDTFHILKNVKKKLNEKQNLKYFTKLIRSKSKAHFELNVKVAYDKLENENDLDLLAKFLKNAHLYCFALAPSVFIGTSISDSISQKVNDLLKARIPLAQPYTLVIQKLCAFSIDLIQKSNQPATLEKRIIQDYYCFPEMKYLRLILCKPIFKQLVNQIKAIYISQAHKESQFRWTVTDQMGINFEVTKNEISSRWECQCGYLTKSGLPCTHLCKIIKVNESYIHEYIHQRWILQIQDRKANHSNFRGRGKKTRRRRGL